MKRLFLSVTDFAIPSPMRGSIEAISGYGGLPDVGTQIHLDIQERRLREIPGYEAEARITRDFKHGERTINVSGRIDGLVRGETDWIEEIKSAYQIDALIAKLQSPEDHPYRRQLLTYGYFHWLETGRIPQLSLCLVNSRTREEITLDVPFDSHEYEEWLARRLDEIAEREKLFEAAWRRRKKATENLTFPFSEQRPGQNDLIAAIDENIAKSKDMVLQAPTGLGKTIGVTFPLLRDSLARGQKLIYLTAKNSQHEAAEDAVTRLQEAGADVRSLTLLAKKKMCFKEEVVCDPHYCEFARDHYTKMQEGDLHSVLLKKKKLNENVLKKVALKHEVCPFDLQMEATAFADVVIGDYNYVFSPNNARGRLLRNSQGKSSALPNLIVDEAHNLPSRANEYFSSELAQNIAARAIVEGTPSEAVRTELSDLNNRLQNYFDLVNSNSPGSGPRVVTLRAEEFADIQAKAQQTLAVYLASGEPLRPNDPVVGVVNTISSFAASLASLREEFVCTLQPGGRGDILRVVCCDAAFWLKEAYEEFSTVIAFSATLKPFDYYQRLLGLEGDVVCREFESPFPRHNRKIILIPQVSTKWRDRDRSAPKIQEAIEKILAVKPGNYFVFFPSFDFMEKIASRLDLPGFEVIVQKRDMHRRDVESILEQLRSARSPTVVFAVQGGIFSEGVDYPGDALIGALIVGPALPNFNFERELLREYYEKKFGSGFTYAYTYPAMARTIQSAGRVIRSGTDRGLIVLMDRRFLEESYVQTMPKDWVEHSPHELVSQTIIDDVKAFWDEGEAIHESPAAAPEII